MVFDSKTALVTGAAKRIGAAIAHALARKGANVVLHCRNSLDEKDKRFLKSKKAKQRENTVIEIQKK